MVSILGEAFTWFREEKLLKLKQVPSSILGEEILRVWGRKNSETQVDFIEHTLKNFSNSNRFHLAYFGNNNLVWGRKVSQTGSI